MAYDGDGGEFDDVGSSRSEVEAHGSGIAQAETLPDVVAMSNQTEIEWFMRPYVLDFLIEIHASCQLLPETLFLAVNLMDRYSSLRVVYKRHYQLVSCAALLIAAKYGDRKDRVPTLCELRCMCMSLYDEDMFRQMERHLLQTIQWVVGHPTVESYLQLYSAMEVIRQMDEDRSVEVMEMARYICEAAMFNQEFISMRPSMLSRLALVLARIILERETLMENYVHSDWERHLLQQLAQNLLQPSRMLYRKYASSECSFVATTAHQFILRQQAIAESMSGERVSDGLQPHKPATSDEIGVTKMEGEEEPTPQTPQKVRLPMHPADMPTPPITPENHNQASYFSRTDHPPPPFVFPTTLTPPNYARLTIGRPADDQMKQEA